jgi:hypothetical protein
VSRQINHIPLDHLEKKGLFYELLHAIRAGRALIGACVAAIVFPCVLFFLVKFHIYPPDIMLNPDACARLI